MTNNAETLASLEAATIKGSTISLIEPVETINCVLDWVKNTPNATATFSYSHEHGWSFTVYTDKEES